MSEAADDGLVVRIGGAPARSAGAGREGAVARRRTAIVQAATTLFLARGYLDTGTDDIAAAAAVSKQTVYNQFGDKASLFAEIILGVSATAEGFAMALPDLLDVHGPDELDTALHALARRYLAAVTDPQVLALRRLIVGEAHRFPDLAAHYWARSPQRVLDALGGAFARLADRGLLAVDDPATAAEHFAYLVLGRLLDRGMFHLETAADPERARRHADRAAAVFLAAYTR